MLIQRMAASFGRLQNDTLELQPGLNILQAPNETGKSTWCAFLLSMLYGINSRERDRPGAPADKNRYAPWSGALMAGRVDCRWNGRDITLLRATRRQGTPMGEFKALYTGTADIVPDLTGQTCGETLLGVTREVYERSAFIRQSGLAVSRDAELERRIAALLTSGEEDVSFSEAAAALKKQLNRRRHNKTGQIPALEAQLAELAAALEQSDGLAVQLERSRREAETLEQRVRSLTEELEAWDRWENAQRSQSLDKLRQEADTARAQADALRAQLEQERIPGSDVIARLRGAIVNLETTRKALHKARDERDEAMKAVLRAEDAVSKSPFAGQTPEQVQRQLETPPQGRPSYTGAAVLGIAGAAAGALTGWGLRTRGTALSIGLAAAVLFFTAFGVFFLVRSQKRKARLAALNRRYGTADADQIARMAEEYSALCQLFGRRSPFVLLLEPGERLVDLIERSHLVQRQADDAALFGQRLQDRLADPPYGIRNKFEAARFVELLGGLDQSQIPLVDQVRQRQALVLVLFRNGNHEPKVGASQFFEGFLVALFDPLRQIYLFLYGNQILFANLLQVFIQRCAFAIGNGFGNF